MKANDFDQDSTDLTPDLRAALGSASAGGNAVNPLNGPELSTAWAKMQERLAHGGAARPDYTSATKRPHRRWIGASAAVLGLALAAIVGPQVIARITPAAQPKVSHREYVTPRGQRANIALSDGTLIQLNVDSKLRVPADLASNRQVYLEGEAQFTVTHDARNPFIVHSRNASVRDLATVFTVRSYDSLSTHVVVASGKVSIGRTAVSAGELATVDTKGQVTVDAAARLDEYLGWTSGHLIFRDTPVKDAFAQLERWYDVKFVIPAKLQGAHLTAKVSSPTLTQATLDELATAIGVRAVRDGRIIKLIEEDR